MQEVSSPPSADHRLSSSEYQCRDALVLPACEPLYGAQICKETNALLIFITQTFSRGSDGQCTKCGKAKGDHYTGASGTKYCYVSTTSPCPPPHVYGFVLLSDACVIVT